MNIRIALPAAILAAATLVAGCSSPGYKRAEGATSSMASTSEQLSRGGGQVDAVVAAIDRIVREKNGDLRDPFDKFNAEINKTETLAERVRERAAAMKAKTEENFTAWAKESQSISSEQLRASSEQRQAEARKTFGSLVEKMQAAKAAYQPFMSDVKDLRAFLDADLTAHGVDAAAGGIESAKSNATKLKAAIQDVQKSLEQFRTQMSPHPVK